MDEQRKQHWRHLEMWTVQESAVLLTGQDPAKHIPERGRYEGVLPPGLEPPGYRRDCAQFDQIFGDKVEMLSRAVLSGSLRVHNGKFLYSAEVIRWAAGRFPKFPYEIEDIPEENASIGKWPWGAHETKLLKHLAAAAKQFWVLYDPKDSSTAPMNADVEEFLVERGVPETMAQKMATILRADDLRPGPRKIL